MTTLALSMGLFLTVLGIAGYIISDGTSVTALIPSFFGIPMAALGIWGRREAIRKHAMHAAAALSLIGLLGTVNGARKAVVLIGGGEVERPAAVVVQGLMALACAVFLIFAVRSFINARRSRGA